MGINLEFADLPQIQNLNVRKEGSGDGGRVAVDLKVKGVAIDPNFEVIRKLTGCNRNQAQAFWRVNKPFEAVFPGIEEMTSIANYDEGQHVNIGDTEYRDVKVNAFKFKPVSGQQVKMTFRIQISDLHEGDLDKLSTHIKAQAPLRAFADRDMFDDLEEMPEEEAKLAEMEEDERYSEAVTYVREHNVATISRIQNGFCIGYNRAARLIERMEEEGVVTPMDSNGNRAVIFEGVNDQVDMDDPEEGKDQQEDAA